MTHEVIEQVLRRAEVSKSDSDFTYFFALLLGAEALAKTIVLGIVASIADDNDRHRYRLEHQLVRADGLGDWERVLYDALSGPASQFLIVDARTEQSELIKVCKTGDWQYMATAELKNALQHLNIASEELPIKSDLKRWFRLFATLRNKTRAHGATRPGHVLEAVICIERSLRLIYENFSLFRRPWAHLHRNLSGKYRISLIANDVSNFNYLTRSQEYQLDNGIYLFIGGLRRVGLMKTDPDLSDFYIPNGGMNGKKYELLSYYTGNKVEGDGSAFSIPPGVLPPSDTEGRGELVPRGNCLSNAPDLIRDYIGRPALEKELLSLLNDDKRPIVTLLGRGGIGKTSLALKVLQDLYCSDRYEGIVWLSSRDVDLQLTGPKPVRPLVLSPDDMGRFYAKLVLSDAEIKKTGFDAKQYLEKQLQKSDMNPCLFIFDNFETTQNPLEMFSWIDAFIKLPNKVLITTRLREFKGDYPLEVGGMTEDESRLLIRQTAISLHIFDLLDERYISELIDKSEGHPYVIKVLLGEVSKTKKTGSIPQLVAGTEDILTALFERTYAALSPCSQRAFLTLSAWNSPVSRLALEAVLFRSTQERSEVEKGIDSLLQYSMAEIYSAPVDKQDFISLPLVASVFGKKKLNISASKASIMSDVEILQMMGPSRKDDLTLGLARKFEKFIGNISNRIDAGESYEKFSPILDAICRAYNPGWLIVARWHMEKRVIAGYSAAKDCLQRFLENAPELPEASEAWKLLGHACYQVGDFLGEVHSFVERAQLSNVPFYDLSNTSNRLNNLLRDGGVDIDKEQKRDLSARVLQIMDQRINEAGADDLSRMAWLAMQTGQEPIAENYIKLGLSIDPENSHLVRLVQRLGLN